MLMHIALSVKIDVALFRNNFSNSEAVSRTILGVASSLGNVKGRDERCAELSALEIIEASGSLGKQEMIAIISIYR